MSKIVSLVAALFFLLTLASFGQSPGTAVSYAEPASGSLSGTWRTSGRFSYVIVPSAERAGGNKVEHDHLDLVQRHAEVEFELTERDDGILLGKNSWTSYDDDGKKLLAGTESLLGARDRGRAVLVESVDKEQGSVQMIFELAADGPNKLVGIGYQAGSRELAALRFELIRQGD